MPLEAQYAAEWHHDQSAQVVVNEPDWRLTASESRYQGHDARSVNNPAPVSALMGLLGKHLAEGELAPKVHGFGVYEHRLVPNILLHLVHWDRDSGLGADAGVVHHAGVCISAPVVSPNSSEAGLRGPTYPSAQISPPRTGQHSRLKLLSRRQSAQRLHSRAR